MTRMAWRRGIPALQSWSRAELALAGALLGLAGLAWLLTGLTAMPDMRTGILTGMSTTPAMPGMPGMVAESMPIGFFLLVWLVMMAAMMLPAITPFTVGMRRMVRARHARRGTLPALTAGYLVVWGAAGVLAYGVVLGFDAIAMHEGVVSMRVGAVVLIGAGLYQFTPLKHWCLVRCRSPLALLVRHGDTVVRSRAGALRVGVHHGGYCFGCCWALMVVLIAAGSMNLVWMAVLAGVIALEKAGPHGQVFGVVLGAALIGLGIFLLAAPGGVMA
jgi:predicted metal-binding membrane protein